jgi:hypothetical protein
VRHTHSYTPTHTHTYIYLPVLKQLLGVICLTPGDVTFEFRFKTTSDSLTTSLTVGSSQVSLILAVHFFITLISSIQHDLLTYASPTIFNIVYLEASLP